MKAVVKCNKCGEYADVDTSTVLTLPSRYDAHCSGWGKYFLKDYGKTWALPKEE